MADLVPDSDLPDSAPAEDLGVTEAVPAGRVSDPLAWQRPPVDRLVPADDLPPDVPPSDLGPPTADALRASFRAVDSVSPDEQGKVLRLSRETGIPADVLTADPRPGPPAVLELLPAHAPALAAHVADPANMAAAKDDLERLSTLEWTLTGGLVTGAKWDAEPLRYQMPVWFEGLRSGMAGLGLGLRKTMTHRLRLEGAVERAGAEGTAPVYIDPRDSPMFDAINEANREDLAIASRDLHAKTLAARAWVGAFQAAPMVGGILAAGAAGGLPLAAGFAAATVYGENVERLEAVEGPPETTLSDLVAGRQATGAPRKLSSGAVEAIAVPVSAVEGLIYGTGLGRLGKWALGPISKQIPGKILDRVLSSQTIAAILGRFAVRFGVAEAEGAATMAVATALEETGIEVARSRVDETHDFDTTSIIDRALETFETGLVDFALLSAFGAGRRLLRDVGVSRASAREAETLRAAAEAVKESKLAERDPAAVEEILAQANPGQSVLVERKAWDEHWASKNIDPRAKAAEIAGDEGRAYDVTSTFIALPMEKAMVRLGKTEHFAALFPDMKVSAESRTPREEMAFQQDQATADIEARKVRGAEIETGKVEIAKIVREQATGAGVDREQAAAVGELVASAAEAVAVRTGLSVNEAAIVMGTGRFRFLGPKAVEVAQATFEAVKAGASPAERANMEALARHDRRATERLVSQLTADPLTELPGPAAFAGYRQNKRPGTWDVALDIQNLGIQDVIGGHDVGDAMLRTIATAMREAQEVVGGAGRLFRRGGDELHAGGFESEAQATAFAKALSGRLKAQPEVAKGFRVSASIGVGPDIAAADLASARSKAKKVAESGTYTKGQAITPEALAKLGAAESYVHVQWEAGPKGETAIAEVAGTPVTVKVEQSAGARGLVRMQIDALGRPVDFPVQLLAGDASTAFHELGHFLSWAMHDVAADPRGMATRGDYLRLLEWAGYKSAEERLHGNLERAELEGKAMRLPAEESRLKSLRAKEERIGHGFEQYLAEGAAPSRPLTRVFAQLRAWMLTVYRGLFAISESYRQQYGEDLQVSDQVRGIFDRWLSAEAAVRQVEADAGLSEATTKALAGLDPKTRETLLRSEQDRIADAEGKVYSTLKQDEQGPRKDLRKKMREEIAAEIDAEPVRKLEVYLKSDKRPEAGILSVATGQLDISLLDEHGRPYRLDRKTLVEDFGEGVVKELPKGATVVDGGVEADFLAERFGFPDGKAMIDALRTMGDRDAVVEARLQDRMRERYPAVIENPAAVVQAAIEAEHTPKAAEAALEAARILVRQVDPSLGLRLKAMEDHAATKAAAEDLIAKQRIAAVQPEIYLASERAYAREALEWTAKALGKGEERAKEYAAKGMDARALQLLNAAYYRAARDARAGARRGATYLLSMTRDDARRELGKATSAVEGPEGTVVTQPYLDRMDDLLESIDFRKPRGPSNRAERFARWLEEQPADARDDILSRVSLGLVRNLDRTRHWTDLTVQEMRDLVGAAETIAAQAKLKSTLRTKQGEREREKIVLDIVNELVARFPRGGGVARFERAQPIGRKIHQVARAGKAILARPEEIYRELGPAASEVFRAISDAQVDASRLIREVGGPIVQTIERLPARDRKILRATYQLDGQPITGEALLAIALNWGNESNRSKLLRGEGRLAGKFRLAKPITPDAFQRALSMLPREVLELVNRVLDQVGNAKWEEIAALEKEFTGLAPPKIEAAPFRVTLADGSEVEVRGGYYPAAYDPRFSTAGQRAGEQIREGVGALAFAPNYERAVTPQGHLQRRIESFARPIDLTLSALPAAVVNHMRDLAMRRALVQTREILTDPRVRDAIQEAMGDNAYRVLVDHWRDSANEYAMPRGVPGMLMRWADRRRTAVTGAVLAGNVGLAVQNFANVLPALDAVPAGLVGKAFGRFMGRRLDMRDEVFALSPYMLERFQAPSTHGALQRSVAGLVGRQGELARGAERIREAGMWMMETTDLVTAIPVWWAAFEHAQRPKGTGARGMPEAGPRATGLGMTREQAIAHADQVVRLTQSSYRFMDRSAFERFILARPFTMFYGYMNAQLSRFLAAHADRRLLADEGFKREAMRRVVKSYALLMASGVMADLLVGKGPQDYDDDGEVGADDWAKWTALRAVLYPPSTAPIVGGYLQQLGTGGGVVRDPSLLPAVRPLVAAGRAVGTAGKAMSEEGTTGDAERAALQALEAVGWYYGLPVVQFRRTGDYWVDVTPDGIEQSLESQAASPAEAAFGTVYGGKGGGRIGRVMFGE